MGLERHDDVFEFQCSVYDLNNRGGDIDNSRVYDEYVDSIDIDHFGNEHIYCTWEHLAPNHLVIHHDHRRPNPDHYWGIKHDHGADDVSG